jgi:N-acetylneuraminic acid mutarotase
MVEALEARRLLAAQIDLASLPLRRFEAQSATVGGKQYVFGGFVDDVSHATRRADVYDPATNTWTRLKNVPEALSHSGTTTDGRTIYFAGGFVGDFLEGVAPGLTRNVWKYDTVTGAWSAGVPLPAPRAAGALVLIGPRLHFFGGIDSAIHDAPDHWVLDLRGKPKWKVVAPMPNPRNHLGYAALDNKVYAIGGQHELNEVTGNVASFDVYDPNTNLWTALPSLPTARSHIHNATVVWEGRLIVLGGTKPGERAVSDVTKFDPAKKRWITIGQLPAPRSAAVAGLLNGHLFVVGGTTTRTAPKTNAWLLEL